MSETPSGPGSSLARPMIHAAPNAYDGSDRCPPRSRALLEFARSWTFRPKVLYIRDQSNSVGFNYSSTEYWLNVRKGF